MTDTSHEKFQDSNQNKDQFTHPDDAKVKEAVQTPVAAQDAQPEANRDSSQKDSQNKDGQNIDDIVKLIENLQAENQDLKDRGLRLIADMENLRRRTEREIADKQKYAITNFAREIVGLADNLKRALGVIPREALKQHPTLNAFYEGVDMTERELMNILERQKIVMIESNGKPFDPNCHQAMFEVPTADVPPGTVIQVMQEGFMIEDRVLRPAFVGVSKALPKVEPQPETSSSGEPQNTADEEPLDLTQVIKDAPASEKESSEVKTLQAETDPSEPKASGQRLNKTA